MDIWFRFYGEIFIGPGGREALDSVFHYVCDKMAEIFGDPFFHVVFHDFFGKIIELLLHLILDEKVAPVIRTGVF